MTTDHGVDIHPRI